jgi:long-chain acyl-CoA synthetase
MSALFNPLLETWSAVVARRTTETAVVEAGSGRSWSFEELQDAGIRRARQMTHQTGVLCPQGPGADFLVSVLAAWEAGQLVCPLDTGATPPAPETWRGLRDAFPHAVMAKSTSGSTGTPRHVLFSSGQLAADATAIIHTMRLRPEQPSLGAISLAHSYGFSNLVLPLLLAGIPLVLADSPLPEAVRAALEVVASGAAGGTRATLPGVPALWRAWFAAGLIATDHIAVALSAGAPLPLELEHRIWSDTGVKIHNFLGSSECGGIAYDQTLEPRTTESLAGTPLDGVSLSVDPGGQLVVQSAAVALSYWPPERVASDAGVPALTPGQFRTGDLAEDRGGTWHLLGRAADTMNLAGRKLHPAELEALLRVHPAVQECLVFSIPSADPARGEEIVATVAMQAAEAAAFDSLPRWLGAQLPSWKCPRHWWQRPDLATTSRGKLPRAEWRRRFLAEQGK